MTASRHLPFSSRELTRSLKLNHQVLRASNNFQFLVTHSNCLKEKKEDFFSSLFNLRNVRMSEKSPTVAFIQPELLNVPAPPPPGAFPPRDLGLFLLPPRIISGFTRGCRATRGCSSVTRRHVSARGCGNSSDRGLQAAAFVLLGRKRGSGWLEAAGPGAHMLTLDHFKEGQTQRVKVRRALPLTKSSATDLCSCS